MLAIFFIEVSYVTLTYERDISSSFQAYSSAVLTFILCYIYMKACTHDMEHKSF